MLYNWQLIDNEETPQHALFLFRCILTIVFANFMHLLIQNMFELVDCCCNYGEAQRRIDLIQ